MQNTNDERYEIFEKKWNLLMDELYKSDERCDRHRAIQLGTSDYYFARYLNNKHILLCYYVEQYYASAKLKSQDEDIPTDFEVYTYIYIYINDMFSYCINGWDRSVEYENIKQECKEIQKQIYVLKCYNENADYNNDETRAFSTNEDYIKFYEGQIIDLLGDLKEKQNQLRKLRLEKRAVQIFKKISGI